MARLSQRKGQTGQAIVMADLRERGHLVQEQQQRRIRTRDGKYIFPDPQGTDLIGSTKEGRALFVEVKCYRGNSVPISERSGLTLRQLAFLLQRERKTHAIAVVAFVRTGAIFYVPASKILERRAKSYRMEWALEDRIEI